MKASLRHTIIFLFVTALCYSQVAQGESTTGEVSNEEERTVGYIRQRNLAGCPYSMGSPCWGVQVCRSGKTACVTPINVFRNEVCGACPSNGNGNGNAGAANNGNEGKATGSDNGEFTGAGDEDTGNAFPQEEEEAEGDGDIETSGNSGTGIIIGKSKPIIFIPNAANCPYSQDSPCIGVKVCRTLNGVPTDLCEKPVNVNKSDICGYCDDQE